MKRDWARLLAMTAVGGILITGCATHQPVVVTPTGQVVVPEAPPPPKHEEVSTVPAGQIWVPGYWSYVANRWVWIPGRYQAVPQAGAMWSPGHWDHTSRGWVWTPGHWE
jgi:hypothetical protein